MASAGSLVDAGEPLERLNVSTSPGQGHGARAGRMCRVADADGDLAADACLAALSIEQGATLVSRDRDFARFEELDWRLPGAESHS